MHAALLALLLGLRLAGYAEGAAAGAWDPATYMHGSSTEPDACDLCERRCP